MKAPIALVEIIMATISDTCLDTVSKRMVCEREMGKFNLTPEQFTYCNEYVNQKLARLTCVSVRLNNEQLEKLCKIVNEKQITISDAIRQLIDEAK